jgi:hypothetical protein
LNNLENKSSSVDISISNINSVTASNIARLSNLETKSASVDISVSNINTFTSSNANTSLNSKTGSYATTGSNTFFGTQTYSGSVYIANDLIVQGSSSIQYISASSVSIGTNIVQLNTANPSVRFAGLSIIDSGSVGGSGSFLYDSKEDEFLFVHRGNGTNVTSSHFIMGPETFDNLGNELYLTCNRLSKGTGKEHLVDSCIFDNGTTTCIKNDLIGTGTACFSNNVCTLNLISKCNIRVGIDGGYSVISGPSTGAGIQLGTNSSTFDRDLNLGFVAANLSFSPTMTINAQTANTCFAASICAPSFIGGAYSGTCGIFSDYLSVAASTGGSSTFWGNMCVSNNKCTYLSGKTTVGWFGTNYFCSAGTGYNKLTIRNTTAGTGNGAQLSIGNDNDADQLYIQSFSSTFTTSGMNIAGGAVINGEGPGGLSIAATQSNIGFYTNGSAVGNLRMIIACAGNVGINCTSPGTTLTVGGTIASSGTICGLGAVYAAGNIRVSSATSAGNSVDPAITTGGCTKIGMWFDTGGVGLGTGGNYLYLCVNGAVNNYTGWNLNNGVVTRYFSGNMQGLTAAYWDIPVYDDNGNGQMIEVKAFFDHYLYSYGAHLYKYMSTRNTAQADITIINCTSGNGGSWTAYKANDTTVRVCKIAGGYVGSGAYWIQVTAKAQ